MAEIIEIPFNVSARTARLIGRENVSNADGAIIELVKNCHDADASNAAIIFADNSLFIIDNGHGMDEAIIRSVWMNIGTNNKEINPFSSKNRVKAGAKGIGRFALDRLGKKVEMFTLPKGDSSGYRWEIDWSAFEVDDSANVGDIKAKLETIQNLDLRKHLPSLGSKKIINFTDGGTVIKISDLRDEWTLDSFKSLFGSLELLVPIVESDSFSIFLAANNFPDELGEVKPLVSDDFDYQINASYDSATHKVVATIVRNELDIELVEKRYSQVFDQPTMAENPFTLTDFKAKSFTREYDIKELLPGFKDEKDLLEKIGNIKFNFIFAKNSMSKEEGKDIYPYRLVEYASRAEWLGRFSGVRIFRDNFRVRPYGEKGNDWLRLGQRQAASPQGAGQRLGAYRIRPNQISGSVHISRVYNRTLEDKSSREGIQENESYELLKEITLGVIGLFEKDRNVVMFSFRELWKKNDEAERKKQKGKAAADHVRQAVSNKSGQVDVAVATDLANANDVLSGEVKEKNEEIAVLRGLASAGLVTAAVAHELRGIENVLATRNSDLKKLISKYIKEDDLSGTRDAFNPYILLAEMQKTDSNLQDWLKYALMPLKRDRRKTKTVYLNEYFNHLLNTWANLLAERQITIEIEKFNDDYSVKMFMIDLDTIFNNMIINSIESFSRKKDKSQRKIIISVSKTSKYYEIVFKDNGDGLDDSFKKKPEEIFLPQVTSKRDSVGNVVGTGMGMYLIKNSVEESNGSVDIVNSRYGFTLVIKLPIYGVGDESGNNV